jgi:hypothetical protein
MYRHYHPALGRYLTPDPIGLAGGLNLYGYAGQNPVNRIDRLGWADDSSPWSVGWEWFTGSEMRHRTFVDNDPFTEILREHFVVKKLVEDVSSCNRPMKGQFHHGLGGLKGIPQYALDYSAIFTNGATGNLAAAYLGSYDVAYFVSDIDPESGVGQLNVTVNNASTLSSATHPPYFGYQEWWKQWIGKPLDALAEFVDGPLRKTTQEFNFTEPMVFDCDCWKGN